MKRLLYGLLTLLALNPAFAQGPKGGGYPKNPTFETVAVGATVQLSPVTLSTAALGSDLTTNGGFTTDLSSWTAGANWTWEAGTDGQARHTAGATATLAQNLTIVSTAVYQITMITTGRTAGYVSMTLGAVTVYGDGASTQFTGNYTYVRTVVASGSGSQALTVTPSTDFDGAITSISVKQMGGFAQTGVTAKDETGSTFFEVRGTNTLGTLFLGLNSGRRNTTGNIALGIGPSALYSNTTGASVLAVGQEAMFSNTNGQHDYGIGHFALHDNTEGSNNLAEGQRSMSSNTTGNYNHAFGHWSLYGNTTGSGNLAVGYAAGRYLANGSTANATASNSVYVGNDTKAAAAGGTNEIVIGKAAVGQGSNTAQIGTSSTNKLCVGNMCWLSGSGAPSVNCTVGWLYSRTDGSTSTTLYVCTAANTWTAK